MIKNIKESYKSVPRTFKHYLAFLRTERKYLGYYKYKFHDLDKLCMYLLFPWLGRKIIHRIHRRINKHHIENYKPISKVNYEEAAIDWECCRLTKPDEPMNAREYLSSIKDSLSEDHWNRMNTQLKHLGL